MPTDHASTPPPKQARVNTLPFTRTSLSPTPSNHTAPSPQVKRESLKPRSPSRASKASSPTFKKPSTKTQSLLTSLLGIKKPTVKTSELTKSNTAASSSSNSNSNSSATKKVSDPRALLKRSHSAQSRLDTIGKDWLSAPIQRPTVTKKKSYDRFIPDRDSMDLESARYNMTKQEDQRYLDYDARSRNERVAAVVGITPNQRILSFKPDAPTINGKAPRTDSNDATAATARKINMSAPPPPTRRILTSPEKILDAPFMTDDYYLNLLDWSSANVVAVGLDRAIYLWNANDGTIQTLNYENEDPVAALSWSSDGAFLAVGTCDGSTEVYDVETNTRLRSMAGHQGRVGVLAWDKHLVSSGSRDTTIWHHDVRVPQHKVAELVGHQDEVCGLKWRSDGGMLASGGNDNIVNLWDARATKPKYTKTNHRGAIKASRSFYLNQPHTAIAWCPWNMNLVATGGGREDKNIHFWNASSGARVNSVFTGSQVTSLIWSKHYKEIMSSHGYPDNQLIVWGYPKLNKIAEIPGHDTRILHTALSPDGQVVASVAADENLKFWRIFEHNGTELLSGDMRQHLLSKRSHSIR
ncbi:WD40-repeat-containing domain protein [Dichotomocladium elegans]|nr:WD40-repeat-containing domain protein [Dichotomocladium elegans]